MKNHLPFTIIFCISCSLSLSAQPGSLDPTFGSGGIVKTSLKPYDGNGITAMAIGKQQQDIVLPEDLRAAFYNIVVSTPGKRIVVKLVR
jgi:hypothetical protein